jgi:excisionase family DNA binding protein
MLTAFEVAEFVGCHEETVRRAYLRGLLVSQRFGVRGRRFHPADVLDWIRRGAPLSGKLSLRYGASSFKPISSLSLHVMMTLLHRG